MGMLYSIKLINVSYSHEFMDVSVLLRGIPLLASINLVLGVGLFDRRSEGAPILHKGIECIKCGPWATLTFLTWPYQPSE